MQYTINAQYTKCIAHPKKKLKGKIRKKARGLFELSPLRPTGSQDSQAERLDHVSNG
jgi:hypothetical protein